MTGSQRDARIGFALVTLAAVVSRLPQLIASPFIPDGDEAILALMARHALLGEGIPVFLWGQRYGFAAPETAIVTAAFAVFGESSAALHASVLVLWILGVLALTAAVRRVVSPAAGWWTAALLVACPAWMAISLKAWGTSVTAFAFSGVALWAAARFADERSRTMACVSAGWLVLAGCANPLWLLFALPPAVAMMWSRADRNDLIAAAGAACATGALLAVASMQGQGYWEPAIFARPSPAYMVLHLPRAVWVTLSGTYTLARETPIGPVAAGAAFVWAIALLVALARLAWRGRAATGFERALATALVLGLGAALFMDRYLFAYRYLLPATTAGIVLVAIALSRATRRGVRASGAALVVALPLVVAEFRHVAPSGYDPDHASFTVAAMDTLVATLRARNVAAVYSVESMLPWSVMFASGGAITARWLDATDRRPAFPRAVDCASARGDPIAFIGRSRQLEPESRERVEIVGREYFLVMNPPPSALRGYGFRLNPC